MPRDSSNTQTTTTDDIKEPIAAIRKDIAELAAALKAFGVERAGEAQEAALARAERLKARGEDLARQGQARAQDVLDDTARRVQEQPLTALSVAAGIGFVVGLLTARR